MSLGLHPQQQYRKQHNRIKTKTEEPTPIAASSPSVQSPPNVVSPGSWRPRRWLILSVSKSLYLNSLAADFRVNCCFVVSLPVAGDDSIVPSNSSNNSAVKILGFCMETIDEMLFKTSFIKMWGSVQKFIIFLSRRVPRFPFRVWI